MKMLPFYHSFGGKTHGPGVELAERLVALAPVPMSKVFFANSGSEANDTAVKLVWYFHNATGKPRKKKIIARARGYHGVTIATASLTGLPNNHLDFDLPIAGMLHTDCPSFYRYGNPGETEEDFAARCANSLEKLILREGPETIGAFIAEPMQGSGGAIIPPRTYWEKVQAVLRRYDILLIADEVICGFGRLGDMFGCETFGIEPDMICLAKQLSAAYQPISAVMINTKIYQAIVEQSRKIGVFGHGFTYGGHPVAAAVAVETLKIYEERNILAHVRSVAPAFELGLQELGKHPLVGEARGKGLIGALEFVSNKTTRTTFDPSIGVAAYAGKRAFEHGVITRASGDIFHICPPLIISEPQIKDLMARIKATLDDTLAWLRQTNEMSGAGSP